MTASLAGLTVGRLGHYDPEYSRNRILAKALQRAGASLIDLRDTRRFPARAPSLARMAHAADLDVILVAFPGQTDVPAAKLASLIRRRPVILDALTSEWETNVVDRRVAAGRSVAGLRARLSDLMACSLADTVLTDTNAHAKWFARQYRLPPSKLRRIWVGADDDVMRPCGSPARGDEFTVFFYGSFIPLQGIEHILGAAALLEARDSGVRFVLCGDGQTYPEMRRLAESRAITSVRFAGRRSLAELRALMCDSSLCLGIFGTNPKAARVIPNKAFDALACGRPLITADTPAVREALVHGEHASLCPPGDPVALAEAIVTLRDDKALRERIAAAGHARFRERFSIDAIAAQLAPVIHEAATAGGNRRA